MLSTGLCVTRHTASKRCHYGHAKSVRKKKNKLESSGRKRRKLERLRKKLRLNNVDLKKKLLKMPRAVEASLLPNQILRQWPKTQGLPKALKAMEVRA